MFGERAAFGLISTVCGRGVPKERGATLSSAVAAKRTGPERLVQTPRAARLSPSHGQPRRSDPAVLRGAQQGIEGDEYDGRMSTSGGLDSRVRIPAVARVMRRHPGFPSAACARTYSAPTTQDAVAFHPRCHPRVSLTRARVNPQHNHLQTFARVHANGPGCSATGTAFYRPTTSCRLPPIVERAFNVDLPGGGTSNATGSVRQYCSAPLSTSSSPTRPISESHCVIMQPCRRLRNFTSQRRRALPRYAPRTREAKLASTTQSESKMF